VARITEVAVLAFVPNFVVQRKALMPMRLQTGGSILAGRLALEHGWSINIGGGFHHCSKDRGGGFCCFADITLLIKFVFHHFRNVVTKVMIIDLDAHQGNGHARDFMDDDDVIILDIYNRNIYPQDGFAKRGITIKVEVQPGVTDAAYLPLVQKHVERAMSDFQPNLVVYNAGTDILRGDPLGRMDISPEGVVKRDEIVFRACRRGNRQVPIVMLTSGGYQLTSAQVIADSILSLERNGLIESNEGVTRILTPN